MKKIAIVPAPGLGDAIIFQVASHNLKLAGFDVTTITSHDFGNWFKGPFAQILEPGFDAIFLQHDNSEKAKQIRAGKVPVYTFFSSYKEDKHGPLNPNFDFVADPDETIVDNVQKAIEVLFKVPADNKNGVILPSNSAHRKYPRRVSIHLGSRDPQKNWPEKRFQKIASFLERSGFEPFFLPEFPNLDALFSFIYESGYFIGNDSGPGHIASLLEIPYLVIGKDEKLLRHWRPGWGPGAVITPLEPLTELKFFRNHWKKLISKRKVIKTLKKSVLRH